ncbi:hypothetical protein E2320_022501 [Naja naja]|nr:hypothetical protein E2320_022501 [Naja naja]
MMIDRAGQIDQRSDYDRSRERDDRRRDDWSDREWDRGRERRSRGEYRDYDRSRRERFSPPRHDLSPPQKRMRRDWWVLLRCLLWGYIGIGPNAALATVQVGLNTIT